MNQTVQNAVLGFSLWKWAKSGHKKGKNQKPLERDISPICRDAPTGDCFEF